MNAHPWEQPSTGAAAALAADVAACIPELETPRLRLRAPRIGDFEAYAAIATTERGVHFGGPMSREAAWLDFAQLVASWLLRGYGVWSVERRADGRLIGFLPLDHEFGDPEPEIGWLLLPEAEGQGFATEAATAARRLAFERLGFGTLVSYVDRTNHRSVGVAERLGARREAATHPLDGDVLVFRHPAPEGYH
jgi:RimJ/RimL family protein N-acetyltransferase